MAVDNTYQTGNFEKQGGAEWDVGNGTSNPGSLVLNAGGTFDSSGATHQKLKAPITLAVVGSNGAGACTATGARVGDVVFAVFGAPTAGGAMVAFVPGTDFESVITVNDQIQQL